MARWRDSPSDFSRVILEDIGQKDQDIFSSTKSRFHRRLHGEIRYSSVQNIDIWGRNVSEIRWISSNIIINKYWGNSPARWCNFLQNRLCISVLGPTMLSNNLLQLLLCICLKDEKTSWREYLMFKTLFWQKLDGDIKISPPVPNVAFCRMLEVR